jgi:hypothetical protein
MSLINRRKEKHFLLCTVKTLFYAWQKLQEKMFKKRIYLEGQGRNVPAAANTRLELRGNQEIHQAGQLRLSVHLHNRARLFWQ